MYLRILTIDGGGIRGVIPARVLQEIEDRSGKRAAELFDLFVGTSTGRILSLCLNVPSEAGPSHSADDLRRLYVERGELIFPRKARGRGFIRQMMDSAQSVGSIGGGNAKFAGNARCFPAGLERVLQDRLGDARLQDSLKPVFVTSFDLGSKRPQILSSGSHPELLMRDAARATSAAPTFFPPAEILASAFVDGGVVANNPAMIGLLTALTAGSDGSDTVIVSLGTGIPGHETPPVLDIKAAKTKPWVALAPELLGMLFDGGSEMQHQLLQGLADAGLGARYWRLQAWLGSVSPAMDDASAAHMNALTQCAETLVARETASLDEIVSALRAP